MTKGDLISREFLQTAFHNFFNGLTHTPTEEDIQRYIEVAPSADVMECARAIKEYCKSKPDNVFLACMKCPFFDGFEKNEMSVCKLFGLPPHEWDLPEGEKGGE